MHFDLTKYIQSSKTISINTRLDWIVRKFPATNRKNRNKTVCMRIFSQLKHYTVASFLKRYLNELCVIYLCIVILFKEKPNGKYLILLNLLVLSFLKTALTDTFTSHPTSQRTHIGWSPFTIIILYWAHSHLDICASRHIVVDLAAIQSLPFQKPQTY